MFDWSTFLQRTFFHGGTSLKEKIILMMCWDQHHVINLQSKNNLHPQRIRS
ncbi:Hypothetical protein Cul210931_0759 [Corynebacterium ulcerans]|uniref:Uncharacterized protein n=1 Tax=Corynebacterium ramonii TaxID=3026968 RepID=A0ABN4EFH8_9CORY|nr:Hypothetical protein Cul210931_0759 [Corynebacterium ulcerans]AIU32349.1 Hypothetical protein CulFRC11_0762 [Corynebacterium ramonii FRC0011]